MRLTCGIIWFHQAFAFKRQLAPLYRAGKSSLLGRAFLNLPDFFEVGTGVGPRQMSESFTNNDNDKQI